MEIKIQVPNPDDYQGNHLEWFAQMRNVLKAAEKIYQQEINGLTEEQKTEVWCDVEIDFPDNEEDREELAIFMSDRKYLEKTYIRIASL